MADTGTQETRQKPGAKKKTPKKAPALYHLFSKSSKGVLTPVGDVEGNNAENAATKFLADPPSDQTAFADEVRQGKAVVVVVPNRNYTEVGAEEHVRTTLRIKARK